MNADKTFLLLLLAVVVLSAAAISGCSDDKSDDNGSPDVATPDTSGAPAAKWMARYPNTVEGAKALVSEFLKPGIDGQAMSAALRPADEDYEAAYGKELGPRLRQRDKISWDSGSVLIRAKTGQTQVLMWRATGEDIAKRAVPVSRFFPGGYEEVREQVQPGVTVYRFKFVKPGATLGIAWDGLIYVNGRWSLIPKPWRTPSK